MKATLAALSAVLLLVGGTAPASADHLPQDPPLESGPYDGALACPETFTGPSNGEPVLLVHGTGVNAEENWGWNHENALVAGGFDVCTVTLPDRSLGDIQLTSEFVVWAILHIRAVSGEPVDVLGHSQGGLQPRWAVKWWHAARDAVDDLVTLASPHHGTIVTNHAWLELLGCSASCWQMAQGSVFLGALNTGDETPGAVSYTSVYSLTDQLVQPAETAKLDGASNVLIQEICPGRPVDHAGFAYDAAVHDVVLDALREPGPFDAERASIGCTDGAFDGVDLVEGATFVAGELVGGSPDDFPEWHYVRAEPELRDYAS